MDKSGFPLYLLELLKIASAKVIAEICLAHGLRGNFNSSRTFVQAALNAEVASGSIDYVKLKNGGVYRVKGCKSNYDDHARLLTEHLAEILKLPLTTNIYREKDIPIGFRSDALVLCQQEEKGICFVLEVANNETHEYLKRKVDAWRRWDKAIEFMSDTFSVPIKSYGFVTSGKEVTGAIPFHQLIDILGGRDD